MNTPLREDFLPGTAARFYGTHAAILQLGEKAPHHLESDLEILASKIVMLGGSVVEGTDVFGEKGPLVLDRDKKPLPYDSGRITAEQIVAGVLEALARQA